MHRPGDRKERQSPMKAPRSKRTRSTPGARPSGVNAAVCKRRPVNKCSCGKSAGVAGVGWLQRGQQDRGRADRTLVRGHRRFPVRHRRPSFENAGESLGHHPHTRRYRSRLHRNGANCTRPDPQNLDLRRREHGQGFEDLGREERPDRHRHRMARLSPQRCTRGVRGSPNVERKAPPLDLGVRSRLRHYVNRRTNAPRESAHAGACPTGYAAHSCPVYVVASRMGHVDLAAVDRSRRPR
jgi:hypothetical protein